MRNDLISRQAAIDALDGEFDITGRKNAETIRDYINGVNKKLRELPSAQPEPCENTVSRQRLLSDLKELVAAWNKYPVMAEQIKGVEAAIGYVEAIPSAQPEQRWIPVTEQLPEEDKEVLISYRYKEGEGDTSHSDIDITSYGQMYFGWRKVEGVKHWRAPFEYFESNYEVIAWMPLPEPYKAESEG